MHNFDAKTSQKVRSVKTKKERREGNIKLDLWVDCVLAMLNIPVTVHSPIGIKYVIIIK